MADARTAVPTSTYRLQLHRDFHLGDALAVVDYLDALGIGALYLSPVSRARPGSVHGYDVIDHTVVNPELGGEEAFGRLAEAVRRRGMGILVDVVPNHMCVATAENAWWTNVLENGPSSPFACHFDLDWRPPKADLADKVLLPALGDPFGTVLERGELRLERSEGAFWVTYFDQRFPLAPRAAPLILEPVRTALAGELGAGDARVLELESVATAFRNLPRRDQTDPEHVTERQREKEVAKRRLAALAADPAVAAALGAVLERLNGTPGDPGTFDALETLLADQAYRLSFWRVASDEINYRRFFDVNELAAIRPEIPAVYEAVHRWPLAAHRRGWVQGLRIDHVDGLLDPLDYLGRLPPTAYVVVEKILVGDERLPPTWPAHGTTGYEMLNALNGLFVDHDRRRRLAETYTRLTGRRDDFADVLYASKRLILRDVMAAEVTALGRRLDRISEAHRATRDFTLRRLTLALTEVIACFPVYRTYVRAEDDVVGETDRAHIQRALREARRRNPVLSPALFDFVGAVLLLHDPPGTDAAQRAERRDFVCRFQQLTGPVMAKGMEDTAGYRYYPLAALNEVGGEPDVFGISLEGFHAFCRERQRTFPHGLTATSTHDTKRDEDVRARLDTLSEMPERFAREAARWRRLTRRLRQVVDGQEVPDANEEYLLHQTLLGTWPLDDVADERYVSRLQEYLLKALREAKTHTSWMNPNEPYESAALAFVAALLRPDARNLFLPELREFARGLVRPGLLSAVSQALLKATVPGVPDYYQGTELFNDSLVDPDNRRPVDFGARRAALAELAKTPDAELPALARRLLADLTSGRLKMHVTHRALRLRRERPRLFADGSYVPLALDGGQARHLVAFARVHEGDAVVTVAARFFTTLPDPPLGAGGFGGTVLELPPELAGRWCDVLTAGVIDAGDGRVPVSNLLTHLPVALLVRENA
jgi:(1->4)-alpha-D-glucan 1-alpha-D-glucosylmutase